MNTNHLRNIGGKIFVFPKKCGIKSEKTVWKIFSYSMIIQTASLLNRVENLNFDVSYKVSFKFVCFKYGFNAIQPESLWEERAGGRCPCFLTSRPLRLGVYNMAQTVFFFTNFPNYLIKLII